MSQTTRKIKPSFIAALSLIGLGLSVYLTQHYYDLRSGASGFHSFCNLGQAANCDVVGLSSYSQLIPGIPLSSVGAGWFFALFMISVILFNRFWEREAKRLGLILSAFSVLVSLGYLVVMHSVLHTYCLFCLAVDLCNVLIFALFLSMKPEGFQVHKPEWKKWKVLLGTAAASFIIGLLLLKTFDTASISSSEIRARVDLVLGAPVSPLSLDDHFASMGPTDAPITITEFSDFQCPFCRMGAFSLNSVLHRYPGQVRVVFRNFPLNPECNRKIDHMMHPVACEAAKSAICAHQQGKFEPLYQELFEQQENLKPGVPLEIAKNLGIDLDRLNGCVNAPETTLSINRDVDEGDRLGVLSTPTFFINGHKMEGIAPIEVWTQIIDRILNSATAGASHP